MQVANYLGKARRMVWAFLLLWLMPACDKEIPMPPPIAGEEEIIRIPIVVHVLYSKDEFNISHEKIASQIRVLNQDFRKLNPDHTKTPAEFAHLVADVGIEFELATLDPDGKPTNGITRTYSTVDGWSGRDLSGQMPVEDLHLYFTNKGGHDAWPTDRYLNIWIAQLSDRSGRVGLAGYAHFPGADARIDGVVIDPRVFGTLPPVVDGHTLGRTATHEIGHWLNLLHIYGSTDTCESTDLVEDTPTASTRYTGNPVYPQQSCGESSMFMNFMDYVNDEAMYMFTKGQRERMRAVFEPGGKRVKLYHYIHGK